MDSDMAAAEEVEKTEGGNQNNGLKHVHDPENDVVYEGELKPEAPPPKRRAHELPSPFVVLAYPPEEPSLFPHQFTTLSLSLYLSVSWLCRGGDGVEAVLYGGRKKLRLLHLHDLRVRYVISQGCWRICW